MTYYCWRCYARNPRGAGRCVCCGQELAPPADSTDADRLIWGLRHPDPDVAILSARRLGAHRGIKIVEALRATVDDPPDPYVAREALLSLLKASSVAAERELLYRLASSGPVLARDVAQRALMGDEPN